MYAVSGHFPKRLMLMLFVGGQSSKGTPFKLKFQVHREVKSWAVLGKPDSNRQKDKHGADPLTQLQDPAVPASIPHNYTGPQIERQFSLLPDPLLLSSLCCSAAASGDVQSTGVGWRYLDVRKGNLSKT